MKLSTRTSGTFVALALMAAEPLVAEKTWQRFEQTQVHMGAKFGVVLYAENAELATRAFQAAAERAGELDDALSDYDPDSELSRLGRASPTNRPVEMSSDLAKVLTAAQTLSERSDGAFDVTVGPLTRLWRRARRRKSLPDPKRLQAARRSVGFQSLVIDPQERVAELLKPHMRLDLGGIAKGYAADEMLSVLARHGVQAALVNAGGDIAVLGAPPDKTGWKIGLNLLGTDDEPQEFVTLRDAGVATSGDAWQFVEIAGVRYSHIVDPRTGLGTTRRGGVTVIAENSMTSDSLASALSVLNVEEGIRLVEQTPGAAALIVWESSDGRRNVRRSQRFPARQ